MNINPVARRLRDVMQIAGITQKQLAHMTGISEKTVSFFLRSKKPVSISLRAGDCRLQPTGECAPSRLGLR